MSEKHFMVVHRLAKGLKNKSNSNKEKLKNMIQHITSKAIHGISVTSDLWTDCNKGYVLNPRRSRLLPENVNSILFSNGIEILIKKLHERQSKLLKFFK